MNIQSRRTGLFATLALCPLIAFSLIYFGTDFFADLVKSFNVMPAEVNVKLLSIGVLAIVGLVIAAIIGRLGADMDLQFAANERDRD